MQGNAVTLLQKMA